MPSAPSSRLCHLTVALRFLWVPCLAALLAAPAPASALEETKDGVATLRVGEVGEPLALLAGIDKGFFAAHKIAIKLVPLSGGPALISATIGGSTDLNYGDVFSWAAAVNNGFDVWMIQPSNRGDASPDESGGWATLLVNPASGIRTPADLKGKRIAIAPTQLTQLLVRLWLDGHGVDSSTVKFVPVTPYVSMGAALQGRHVDAMLDADPFTQRDEKQYGFQVLGVPSRAKATGASTAGYYATGTWLHQHGDVARRFVAAYRQAAAWANKASPTDKAAVLAKYSPIDLNKLQQEIPGIVENFHYYYFDQGPIDLVATQAWINLAAQYHLLDQKIELAKHLYPTATEAGLE
jgi:ABC-type nitrate/sulfonate/bicarbonate transport system substrate-binding protein